MKNSKRLFQELSNRLAAHETPEEAEAIALLILHQLFSVGYTQMLGEKQIDFADADAARLEAIVTRVLQGEPVQYVLGEAEFYGRTFEVTPHVLIPRPETEELVRLVIHYAKSLRHTARILDVGTGSGCIPVTLAKELAIAAVYGIDISEGALSVARRNAERHRADVTFFKHDILHQAPSLQPLDVVVSNPPYIPIAERASMRSNVIAHEPHLALFVPDDDPLQFYKALTTHAATALRPGALLAVEINERFGTDVAALFGQHNFHDVAVIKDMAGKDRIVKGIYT